MIATNVKKIRISKSLISELEQLGVNDTGESSLVFNTDDPTKLIKRPKNGVYSEKELQYFKIMQENPQCFGKIFKISETEVIVEKLKISYHFYDLFQKYVDEFGYDFYTFLDEVAEKGIYYNQEANNEMISKIKADDKIFFLEVVGLLSKISKIIDKFTFGIDIHAKQFAYDMSNKLKMVDI